MIACIDASMAAMLGAPVSQRTPPYWPVTSAPNTVLSPPVAVAAAASATPCCIAAPIWPFAAVACTAVTYA